MRPDSIAYAYAARCALLLIRRRAAELFQLIRERVSVLHRLLGLLGSAGMIGVMASGEHCEIQSSLCLLLLSACPER